MDADERQQRQHAVERQVGTDPNQPVVGIQLDGHDGGQRGADDGRQVVGQRRTRIAHLGGEQFGQQRRHGTEGAAHQHHAHQHEGQHRGGRAVQQELRHEQAEGNDGHRDPDEPAAPSDAIGHDAREAGEDAEDHGTDHQEAREGVGRNTQAHGVAGRRHHRRALGEDLHEGRHHVEQHIGGRHDEGTLHDGLPVVQYHFLDRGAHLLVALLGLTEDMAFMQGQPHVEAHCHHHDGSNERNAPGPFHQCFGAE